MITAEEARQLSGPSAEDYLNELDPLIRKAAINKEREIIIRKNPYAEWLYDEKDLSPEARRAVGLLRDAGYKLSLYYVELQFVDMGLQIEW